MNCVWLSIDPVRRKVDFYPRHIALRIEKSYNERDLWISSECVLGSDFFNSTIHFHPSGSCYQTTPGMSLGRAGFKQPGYRSVKRVILNDEETHIDVFSKQVHSEWRLANNNNDAEITFNELVPSECKIEINNEDIQTEKIETWKPHDLHSNSFDTNIIVWQWCRGTFENQGNLFGLSNEWFLPYNYEITQQIELAFNNNNNTIIDLPVIGQREIQFVNGTCYAKQKTLDGTGVRFVRRIVTTIQELRIMLDCISNPPIDINEILENLPDGSVPHHFNCPILQDIMKDPVKTVDGHVYDRTAIERWFTHNQTSPLTGLYLNSTMLQPFTELKNQIDEFLSSLINEKNTNTTTSQVLIENNNLLHDNDYGENSDDSDDSDDIF